MDGAWHVFLRDILIIVSAAALLVTLIMTMLVSWQVLRLARELRDEVQPILASVKDTADTVRHTADFVGGKVVSPAATAVGSAAGARGLIVIMRELYQVYERVRRGDGAEEDSS